nr:MAG TPA: Major capsid protein [Caudoviricetes sp.]
MTTLNPSVVTPVNASGQWGPQTSVPTPTTPYSGTFIPTVWSGKLARKFYANTIFGAIANSDWYGEISNMGDKVIINTIPDITVKPYKVGMQLEYEVPQGETFELVVDEGCYYAVNVNDVMEYQAKPQLMNMFTTDAAQQMKLAVDARGIAKTFFTAEGKLKTDEKGYKAVWTKNVGANAGARTGSYNLGTDAAPVALTPDNILSYITQLSTVLDEADIPEDGRYLVITPYERQILMNSNLAQAQFMGDAKSVLRNGLIGKIDRFEIYVNNLLPRAAEGKTWDTKAESFTPGEETDAKKRHLIWAGQKSGISFASQITKTENLRNPNDFGSLVRGLNIWGTQVVQGQCLAPMIVAN